VIEVEAKPEPIRLDLPRTAVLVIDMQNDFGSAGGMFDRAGIDITGIQQAVAPTRRVLDGARQAGLPIVHVRMAHPPDLVNAGPTDSPHRRKHVPMQLGDGRVLVEGTWNTRILPELEPQAGEPVVTKHRYSGFFETELDSLLRSLDAYTLVTVGFDSRICLASTTIDAMYRNYRVVVLRDSIGTSPYSTGENAETGNGEWAAASAVRFIETNVGYTATSEQWITACEQASGGVPR
jgi:ureidoacrylate peracid hydrolase